jgi:hypothetical protein
VLLPKLLPKWCESSKKIKNSSAVLYLSFILCFIYHEKFENFKITIVFPRLELTFSFLAVQLVPPGVEHQDDKEWFVAEMKQEAAADCSLTEQLQTFHLIIEMTCLSAKQ